MDKIDSGTVMRACGFAKKAHKDQMYGDESYFNSHLVRVAWLYEDKFGHDPLGVVLCYLHDVVEDTDTEVEEIEKVFGWDVAVNVWDLTKQKGQSYQDYLQNLSCDTTLTKVKWADSYVNLMKCIETEQFGRGKKYLKNLEYLSKVLKEEF